MEGDGAFVVEGPPDGGDPLEVVGPRPVDRGFRAEHGFRLARRTDEKAGPRVGERMTQLAHRDDGVDVDHDGARAGDRIGENRLVDRLREMDAHPIAALDAKAHQAPSPVLRTLDQLFVGHGLFAPLERGSAPTSGVRIQQRCQCEWVHGNLSWQSATSRAA